MIRIAKVIMLIFRISATELHVFPNWLILYLLQIILPMLGMTAIAMKIMVSHGKKLTREFISPSLLCVFNLPGRALPDIMSGPEVRQIFKILTLRKPDVFLPGCRILKKMKKKIQNSFLKFFSNFFGLGTFDFVSKDLIL